MLPSLVLPCTTFFLSFCVKLSFAERSWIKLPLRGPEILVPYFTEQNTYYVDVRLGSDRVSQPCAVDFSTLPGVTIFESASCPFCFGEELFNPAGSSTFNVVSPWTPSAKSISGRKVKDTISFGGILTQEQVDFDLAEKLSFGLGPSDFPLPYFRNGLLGFIVDPANVTARDSHVLSLMYKSGQLLNPVVGVSFGNSSKDSFLTIGALDPNDYDGEINWVESPTPQSPSGPVIPIDGFKGMNGSFLPNLTSPAFSYIDSFNPNILVPNAPQYFLEPNYSGLQTTDVVNSSDTFYVACGDVKHPNISLPFTVTINGIDYPIDSAGNLFQSDDLTALENLPPCSAGILSSHTTPASVPVLLGLPFLRSVYLAYRFPTEECPKTYYGFAFPKSRGRPSSIISQTPRSTPSDAGKCLSFSTPSSTPVPQPPKYQSEIGLQGNYRVAGDGSGRKVPLRGADELKPGVAMIPMDF